MCIRDRCTVDLTSLFKAFSYAMDIYLFCYDASFMATAPSFIAMSQGNHMDFMTFLSSSDVCYLEFSEIYGWSTFVLYQDVLTSLTGILTCLSIGFHSRISLCSKSGCIKLVTRTCH